MFGSIASETALSKPFWCICWWVIYRTTTSVDLVICWLHCEQMERLACWIKNNDFKSKVNSPNVLTWNMSLNRALADMSVNPWCGGGGTPRKIGWGGAARFPKPLPYLWPRFAILPTLFMTWPKIQNPIYDLTLKSNPVSDQRYKKFPSSNHC